MIGVRYRPTGGEAQPVQGLGAPRLPLAHQQLIAHALKCYSLHWKYVEDPQHPFGGYVLGYDHTRLELYEV